MYRNSRSVVDFQAVVLLYISPCIFFSISPFTQTSQPHSLQGQIHRLDIVELLDTGWNSIQNHRLKHYGVIKWKHFPHYWPFMRGIHRSPVKSPHKDQWRGTLMFSLICAWINDWLNNQNASYLRRHRTHYNITVTGWSWCPQDWGFAWPLGMLTSCFLKTNEWS